MKKVVIALAIAALLLAVPAATMASAPPAGAGIGNWQASMTGGFGAGKANGTAGPMVTFDGKVFTGVSNDNGANVRFFDGAGWQKASDPLLGTAKDVMVGRMAVFGGKLYAGTVDQTDGCSVYRYDGGTTWTQVINSRGFGNKNNVAVASMAVYGDKLYVGTGNVSIGLSGVGSDGAEVWSYDGLTWNREATGGFGDKSNVAVSMLTVYNGGLYAGTARTQFSTQFVSFTEIKLTATSKGCQLRALSGGSWPVIADNGITDTRNIAIISTAIYGGKLFVGTANADGSATVTGNFLTGDVKLSAFNYNTSGLCVYSYDGGPVREVVKGGIDSRDDLAMTAMDVMNVSGKDVLLGSVARAGSPCLLKVYDGAGWFNGADPGFGSSTNDAIVGLCVSANVAYAGTANGTSGCDIYTGAPPASAADAAKTWYLAEGCTSYGFETWVLVQNPGDSQTTAKLTFLTPNGQVAGPSVVLPTGTRQTVDVSQYAQNTDVSTVVNADKGVICERAMYWKNRKAGHDSIGVTSPSPVWLLAEGSTNGGFETWILIENPGNTDATASLTYMTKAGEKKGPQIVLPPGTRKTVDVSATVPAEWEVSTKVTADAPVIAERAVYWNGRNGGHDSIGVTSPSSTWYLAEGCTAQGFETWVLVQNPGTAVATAKLTYMTPSGSKQGPTLTLQPGTRQTVDVSVVVKNETDVSTRVDSDYPVVCERAVYWNNRIEGHDSVGVTSPAKQWFLAEGSTSGFETWVLIQNPGDTAAAAKLVFMTPRGAIEGPTVNLAPGTRKSVSVGQFVAGEASVSTKVTSNVPVICERAVYWNNRQGGHDSIGASF